VSFYLDASVLVALLTPDPLSARAEAFLSTGVQGFFVSDFAAAEFVSVVGRRIRSLEITFPDGRIALANLDAWAARAAQRVDISTADVTVADAYLRRLDLTLVTPDALHIAIAGRLGAPLVTFDRQMAANARTLGLEVADA
jgi:predicted nucleic acid-binding protein